MKIKLLEERERKKAADSINYFLLESLSQDREEEEEERKLSEFDSLWDIDCSWWFGQTVKDVLIILPNFLPNHLHLYLLYNILLLRVKRDFLMRTC
jgi:hypothetical protein